MPQNIRLSSATCMKYSVSIAVVTLVLFLAGSFYQSQPVVVLAKLFAAVTLAVFMFANFVRIGEYNK